MKPSEAAKAIRDVGLTADEAAITFTMLGKAVQEGNIPELRRVALFRMVRMRDQHGLGRFLLREYWRWLWLAVRPERKGRS